MRKHLITAGVGFGGVMVGLLVWHLWLDHTALHQIINVLNAQAARAQQVQQAPQPAEVAK